MADNTGADISTMEGAGKTADQSGHEHTPKRQIRRGYHGMSDDGAAMSNSATHYPTGSDTPQTSPTNTGKLSI